MQTLKAPALHVPRISALALTTLAAALLIGAPVLIALFTGLVGGGGEAWSHIVSTQLLGYTLTTLGVIFFTAVFILLFAVPGIADWYLGWR